MSDIASSLISQAVKMYDDDLQVGIDEQFGGGNEDVEISLITKCQIKSCYSEARRYS